MAAADVLFVPSRSEGISLALYEAMASGTPVVGARVGGQAELVTEDCGVLVERSTPAEEAVLYADAIEPLLRDPERRAAMGAAARARVETTFPLERLGLRLDELLGRASSFTEPILSPSPERHWRAIPPPRRSRCCGYDGSWKPTGVIGSRPVDLRGIGVSVYCFYAGALPVRRTSRDPPRLDLAPALARSSWRESSLAHLHERSDDRPHGSLRVSRHLSAENARGRSRRAGHCPDAHPRPAAGRALAERRVAPGRSRLGRGLPGLRRRCRCDRPPRAHEHAADLEPRTCRAMPR